MSARHTVLFVCVHNAGRSQMAAALLARAAGERVEVLSAGSAPAESVNPAVVEAMREVGIDITSEKPKLLEVAAVEASDVVREQARRDTAQIDADLRHAGEHLRMHAGAGRGPRRDGARLPAVRQRVEPGCSHLRATRVVDTSEQDGLHARSP